MKQGIYKITENKMLAPLVYRMLLEGEMGEDIKAGQFVNIKIDGFYLRRPISLCDFNSDSMTLIYKVVGHGTDVMCKMEPGTKLDILTDLGNGYDITKAGERPLLLGGGAGVPPMYALAKKLIAEGCHVTAILGFNTKDEIFYEQEFADLGCRTIVTTVDGSYGVKGFVTDAMPEDYTYFYTCGPEVMMKAIYDISKSEGQCSFEERMGCGFGACMGCSCKTKYGNKRICKDGPVLKKEEIIW